MRQSKRAILAVIAAVVAALVITLAVVIALGGPRSDGSDDAPAAAPRPITEPSPTQQTYTIEDRPEYDPAVAHLDDLVEGYLAAYEDNSIYEHVPTSTEGHEYVWDFLYLLDLQREGLHEARGTVSTEAAELDAMIADFRDEADEVERRFLGSEDFEVQITAEREDGTTYESDGAAPAKDPEEWARDHEPRADPDGSYVPAGEEVAAAFGLSLTTDWSAFDDDGECAAHEFDSAEVAGYYCGATPEVIYINDDHEQFPAMYHDVFFYHLVLHELGHHQMGLICTDGNPPIAGDLLEGVTSSYAVLYLGASASELDRVDDPEYEMSEETDDIARQIREEYRCE